MNTKIMNILAGFHKDLIQLKKDHLGFQCLIEEYGLLAGIDQVVDDTAQ